jgi:chromosome segregation ATPase
VTSESARQEVDRPGHESEQRKQTRIDAESTRQAAEHASKELMQLRQIQQQLENELSTMRTTKSETEAALQDAYANLRTVEEKHASQLEVAAKAESAKHELKQRVEETVRANDDAKRALAQAKSEIALFQDAHTKAKEDLSSCMQNLESQGANSTRIQEELTARISRIEIEKLEAEGQAKVARDTLGETNTELDRLRADMSDQAAKLASCEAAKHAATDEVERANKEVNRARQLASDEATAGKEKDERIAHLHEAVKDMHKRFTKANEELGTQEAAKAELTSRMREVQEAEARANEQAKEARDALHAIRGEMETDMVVRASLAEKQNKRLRDKWTQITPQSNSTQT